MSWTALWCFAAMLLPCSCHRFTCTMKVASNSNYGVLLLLLLLLIAAVSTIEATHAPTPFSEQFKVVIDNSKSSTIHHQNKRLLNNIQRTSCSKDRDLRKIFGDVHVKELYQKAATVVDKVKAEARELVGKCQKAAQNYSKAEIGLYTSLACALTFALQAVFTRTPCKTLDVGIITYILSQASTNHETIKELKKPKRTLKLYSTSSVFSNDGKTYVRLLKTTTTSTSPSKRPLAVHSQESQVSISPVQAFYDEQPGVVPPASHNAVLSDMTPYMRHKLKARRMRGGALSPGLQDRLTVGFYFAAWYALNIVYNIINKKVLNVLPAPLIVGTFQFGIGALYCALVWIVGLRPMPKLTSNGKTAVANVGMYHALGQLASMISLGAGPVSFTHIVKAMEPFFSAVVSGLYFKKWMKPQVYMTLIPVVCGVGYACMKELNFSWLAFSAAMSSNLFFALRAVMSKLALQSGDSGSNLTPPNMFGLVTWAAFVMSIPMALIGEGKGFMGLWEIALNTVEDHGKFFQSLVISGLVHYLNNEVMYMALGKVHPVTLAVGNTMKRVFILVASVMVFRNPITVQAGIGSGVGIGGVLLYSLTKQYYEKQEAAELAAIKSSKKGWKRLFEKRN